MKRRVTQSWRSPGRRKLDLDAAPRPFRRKTGEMQGAKTDRESGQVKMVQFRYRPDSSQGDCDENLKEEEINMAVRNAEAVWEGNLKEGRGRMSFGSGAFEGAFSYASRFEEGTGTNPEELIGAAHAGCFSMAFANLLSQAGFTPDRVNTRAQVHLGRVDGKARITRVHLETEAIVPGIDEQKFQEIAQAAKEGCPVSNALTGVEITLDAKLAQ